MIYLAVPGYALPMYALPVFAIPAIDAGGGGSGTAQNSSFAWKQLIGM